ncbi:hypothetical protein O181_120039 [Austropuccinia psidii MF-1]|uniref:Uncharacterized protein n=1 Tax=Austropuccinia psidii MF-1 TaxID=1389203 RepID=A0A9Q3Q008_9BASI|nr:hypothetical protein [Austropuccinia psidii MF-1]
MSFENDKYSMDKYPYEWLVRKFKGLKAIDPQMNIQVRNHKLLTQIPGELEHAVKCRCNHNCTTSGRSGKEETFLSQQWFNRPLCQQLSKGKEKRLCH